MKSSRKSQKTSKNSNNPKIIEKLLLGLIGPSIYVCSCKKMRYSVKTPLPNKRHKQTNKLWGRSFCPFLRSQRFCATHQNAPRTKDVQIIGELTNSQWKWLRLLKLHKRSFYSAVIDKKTVEKLFFLSFTAG